MDLDDILVEIVNKLDIKREKVEEEAKKSSQYKKSKRYKQTDSRYIDELLIKRNTLVFVINYIRSKQEEYLKKLEE